MRTPRGRLLALAVGVALAAPLVLWAWPRIGRTESHVGFFRASESAAAWRRPADGLLESRTGLRRWRISESAARKVLPILHELNVYDEHTYYRYAPHLDEVRRYPRVRGRGWRFRTDSIGLREDDEILATQPDLRVLVAGDSNSEGVCDNADSFTNRLESLLRAERPDETVECINGAHSGFAFYEYLGTLERFLHLDPDVLVVAFYGGNDFVETLKLHHVFHGTKFPRRNEQQIRKALAIDRFLTPQVTMSALFFQRNPDQRYVALRAAKHVVVEIEALCEERDVQLAFVYVPPVSDVWPGVLGERLEALERELGMTLADLQVHDRIATRLIEFLRERDHHVIDMRAKFEDLPNAPYWKNEWHMDLVAQALIARHLLPFVLEVHGGAPPEPR